MLEQESVIAVYGEHTAADDAVKRLMNAGIIFGHLSVVGKGSHTEEKVVGFYNIGGDRIKFLGRRGDLWSRLWRLFVVGVSLTIPGAGQIIILGYLAAIVVAALEGSIMVGGLSALGAALYSSGVPKDNAIQYEQVVRADGFLVILHGEGEELTRALGILAHDHPSRLDLYAA
jgi:hypothetical protein